MRGDPWGDNGQAALLVLGAQASPLAGVMAVGTGLGAGVVLWLLASARPGRVQGLIMRTATPWPPEVLELQV